MFEFRITATTTTTQIIHSHNTNNQTSPAREMLRSLSLARFRVVLFPGETRVGPFAVYVLDQVLAETAVYTQGLGLMGGWGAGDVLGKDTD